MSTTQQPQRHVSRRHSTSPDRTKRKRRKRAIHTSEGNGVEVDQISKSSPRLGSSRKSFILASEEGSGSEENLLPRNPNRRRDKAIGPKRRRTKENIALSGLDGPARASGRQLKNNSSTIGQIQLGMMVFPLTETTHGEDVKDSMDLFVTILYGYLVNRTINECSPEDIRAIFEEHLHFDFGIGKHIVRRSCLLNNWDNYIFRNPPGMVDADADREDPHYLSTLLYISKSKHKDCDYPICACKSTQGHLRWTKSLNGQQLEVFTFDWSHNEVEATFTPIGF